MLHSVTKNITLEDTWKGFGFLLLPSCLSTLRAVVFAEMCQSLRAEGARHKAVGWLPTHVKQPRGRTTAFCWQHTANRGGKWEQANCSKKDRLVWANPQTSAVLIYFSPWATHSCQNKDWQPGEGTQAATQEPGLNPNFFSETLKMRPFLECPTHSGVLQTYIAMAQIKAWTADERWHSDVGHFTRSKAKPINLIQRW